MGVYGLGLQEFWGMVSGFQGCGLGLRLGCPVLQKHGHRCLGTKTEAGSQNYFQSRHGGLP